jgi:hypothetical protein
MKEYVQFHYRCVYMYYTSNSVVNYLYPSAFENDLFQETAITMYALLHLTWERGHYVLQQEFRDGFSAVLKSPF